MSEPESQDWHKFYQDAMAETASGRRPQLIAAAEKMIFLRWNALSGSPNENSERLAIHNALNDLRHLKAGKRNARASRSGVA